MTPEPSNVISLQDIRAAKAKADAGVWVKGIRLDELGVSISIRARTLSNPDASRLRSALVSALTAEQRENLPTEVSDDIFAEILATTVVTGWSLDEPCSKALLLDPDIGIYLRGAATYAASEVAKRGVASFEADAKN